MKGFKTALAAVFAGLLLWTAPAEAASRHKARQDGSERKASAKASSKDEGRKAQRSERSSTKNERSKAGKEHGRRKAEAESGSRKAGGARSTRRERDSGDSGDSAETRSRCTSKRVKQGRKTRTVKVCEKPEPVLQSPIRNTNIEAPVTDGRETEIKARSVPERAYAVDGSTFFFQGRKYRVQGLSGQDGSDMTKQRLQRALDSGSLAVEVLRVDETGGSDANVKINGRDLKDLLPPSP